MLDVDPDLLDDWPERHTLLWAVEDDDTDGRSIVEALDALDVPTDLRPQYVSPAIPHPDGFLVAVDDARPALLGPWVDAVERRGLTNGRVRAFHLGDVEAENRLFRSPLVAGWVVPVDDDITPWIREMTSRMDPAEIVFVTNEFATWTMPVHDLDVWVQRWWRLGIIISVYTRSTPPSDVNVFAPRSGGKLIGRGLIPDDEDTASRTLQEAARWLERKADDIEYGVATVHDVSVCALIGHPFEEAQPPTDTAQLIDRTLRNIDRVVPDAGYVQILGPGHVVRPAPDIHQRQITRSRRLVTVGDAASWVDNAARPSIRSVGRDALHSSLPDRQGLHVLGN